MRLQIDLTRYTDDNNEEWEESFEMELPDRLSGEEVAQEIAAEIAERYPQA
jgi:hypothetical protein